MKKELEKEQEKIQVSEVKNEILETIIRNNIVGDNNNKVKINELKELSGKKDIQAEQCKIIIASVEALANILLSGEQKKEKERREYQGKLATLKINNNQLLIEIKKRKQEVLMLKTSLEKVKKGTNHNKVKTREHVEMKEYNKMLRKRIGRHEANKKKL